MTMNGFFYLLTELDTPTEPPMPKIYNTDGYSGKKDDVKYFCYMFNLCDNYLFIFLSIFQIMIQMIGMQCLTMKMTTQTKIILTNLVAGKEVTIGVKILFSKTF